LIHVVSFVHVIFLLGYFFPPRNSQSFAHKVTSSPIRREPSLYFSLGYKVNSLPTEYTEEKFTRLSDMDQKDSYIWDIFVRLRVRSIESLYKRDLFGRTHRDLQRALRYKCLRVDSLVQGTDSDPDQKHLDMTRSSEEWLPNGWDDILEYISHAGSNFLLFIFFPRAHSPKVSFPQLRGSRLITFDDTFLGDFKMYLGTALRRKINYVEGRWRSSRTPDVTVKVIIISKSAHYFF